LVRKVNLEVPEMSPNSRGIAPIMAIEKEFSRSIESLECAHVEELVNAYVDGELPTALNSKFQAHLLKCPDCSEMIDDVVAIVEVARTLSSRALPSGISERLREHLAREVGFTPRPRLTLVK